MRHLDKMHYQKIRGIFILNIKSAKSNDFSVADETINNSNTKSIWTSIFEIVIDMQVDRDNSYPNFSKRLWRSLPNLYANAVEK